jgi:hypothetical protein
MIKGESQYQYSYSLKQGENIKVGGEDKFGSLPFSPYPIPISTCWDSGGEDVLLLSYLRGERNNFGDISILRNAIFYMFSISWYCWVLLPLIGRILLCFLTLFSQVYFYYKNAQELKVSICIISLIKMISCFLHILFARVKSWTRIHLIHIYLMHIAKIHMTPYIPSTICVSMHSKATIL